MQGFSILEYTARRGKKKTEASLLPFSFLLFELVDHVNVDVRYDCQNNEYKGKDRGYAAEDLVSGLALACAEKALGSTGNGAGQTLILTRLAKHACNQSNGKHAKDNTQCNLNSGHRRKPPN
jgi:hypothetical protein